MSYVVPATGIRGRPSIYAELVAEWRAKGRAVPGRRDTAWDHATAADGRPTAVTSSAVGPCAGLAPAADAEPAGEPHADEPGHVPAILVPRGLPGPVFVWEGSACGGRVGVAGPLKAD
ncbi:hypothetical protein IM697_17460 [Streptomyces ferrugineus]|uniref:Uncharacterized protein n=1 Tax=Streptomyces ferrugineus TaxID=1413221 RepID=A0A7M2SUS6_9ACTN|nr:hypothetical protein [Streptomyces ferrugineus]QOV40022.1 hypothetical protein IM697_17460 [Streptomyces ferrugineus]